MIRMSDFKTAITLLLLGFIVGCEDQNTTNTPQNKPSTIVNEVTPTIPPPSETAASVSDALSHPIAESQPSRDIILSIPSASFTTTILLQETTTQPDVRQQENTGTIQPVASSEVKTQQMMIHLPANSTATQQVSYSFNSSDNHHVIEVIKPQVVTEHHYNVPGYKVSYDLPDATEELTTPMMQK